MHHIFFPSLVPRHARYKEENCILFNIIHLLLYTKTSIYLVIITSNKIKINY